MKKVLVIGSGGREHAIVDALGRSPQVGEIFCAPGNAGISLQATCVPIKDTDVEEKFIRLRPTLQSGHLYLSPIPVRYLTEGDPLLRRVSLALVKTEEKQPSVLRLCGTHLEFRDIIESF